AGVIESRTLARAAAFDIASVVFHVDGVMAEAAETVCPQEMGKPIAARLERGIAHYLARCRHDEGGLLGAALHLDARIHGALSRGKSCHCERGEAISIRGAPGRREIAAAACGLLAM